MSIAMVIMIQFTGLLCYLLGPSLEQPQLFSFAGAFSSPRTRSPRRIGRNTILPLHSSALANDTDDANTATITFSLVSWNVLTPQFATVRSYPWASAAELSWPRRQELILQRLADADADVVCLQEMAPDCWDGFLAEAQRQGYDGVLQDVKPGHPFANAVLLKRGTFDLVRSESRSRALIVVLRACSNPTAPLYLANVHLHSGVRGGDMLPANARFFQIRSLLRRIELQCAKDAVRDGAGAGAGASLVLCGDFNMDGTMYELLVNGRATQSREYADYTHPLLPLVDAYASTPPMGPLRSSHRSGSLLDFIFVTDAMAVLRTTPLAELSRRMPSAEHPSDHLPIGALLSCVLDSGGSAGPEDDNDVLPSISDSELPAGLTDEMLRDFILETWGVKKVTCRRSSELRLLSKLLRALCVADLWPHEPADRFRNKKKLLCALHRIRGDVSDTGTETLDPSVSFRVEALERMATLTLDDIKCNPELVERNQG